MLYCKYVLIIILCIFYSGVTTASINTLSPPAQLSLNFQDIKVRHVLQLLAEFSQKNIVMSDTVQGNITLRLNNLTWQQALNIILKARGLEKRLIEGVLYIAPTEELANRDKQALMVKQQLTNFEPLYSELIRLNYAHAADIATLLKSKSNTLLSARGSVSVDERTNMLWIQEIPQKLTEIRRLIHQLDFPVKQVLIAMRVVNLNKNYERNLGLKFNLAHLHVDIASTHQFGLALAKIVDNNLLDIELAALERQGQAKVIASPRLITADQKEAVIEAGEEIPYQETAANGATSVEFKKAVLSLRATPQITPNNKILLKLKINQDKRGVTTNGVPSIDTRALESFILAENGQTIVLGGVYQQDNVNELRRVPLLSSIPIIGALFNHRAKIDARQELLIFVTPRIITEQDNN